MIKIIIKSQIGTLISNIKTKKEGTNDFEIEHIICLGKIFSKNTIFLLNNSSINIFMHELQRCKLVGFITCQNLKVLNFELFCHLNVILITNYKINYKKKNDELS